MKQSNLAVANQQTPSTQQDAWWYADGSQAIGPVTREQFLALNANGRIEDLTYVFSHDIGSWITMASAWAHLGIEKEDLKRSKRLYIENLGLAGRVYAHDQESFVEGRPLNISTTGMFLLTEELKFQVGDIVSTTIKIPGLIAPMNMRCEVMRMEQRDEYQPGYGLRFCENHEQLERLNFRII